MEPIVLDDEPSTSVVDSEIINLDDDQNDGVELIEIETANDLYKSRFDDIHEEDPVFGDFIEKCLNADNSDSMLRVINRILLPLYRENGRVFKCAYDQQSYNRALTKTINNIEIDPNHRYSHIKELCEALKSLKRKRKVPFTTLSKNVAAHRKKRLKRTKLKIVDNVIHLDDDDEIPIVDSDVISNNTAVPDANIVTVTENNVGGNVNAKRKIAGTTADHYIEIDLSTPIYDSESNGLNNQENVSSSTEVVSQIALEDPQTVIDNSQAREISENAISSTTTVLQDNIYPAKEIDMIEQTIATYKKIVDEYSLQEVTEDTLESPYLQCNFFQSRIVKLYERLCTLTGSRCVKRRTVRLHAIDSRPELPIKKLEELINNNIGSNGLPQFPDFDEVLQCVAEANFEGNLGWHSKQIMEEARALFTHCGRAIQRTRQQREYRDLMSLVKDETLEDPAEKDPDLNAKLKKNRFIAKCKETAILHKYSNVDINLFANFAAAADSGVVGDDSVGMAQNDDIVNRESNTAMQTVNYNEKSDACVPPNVADDNQIKILDIYSCKEIDSEKPPAADVSNNSGAIDASSMITGPLLQNESDIPKENTFNLSTDPANDNKGSIVNTDNISGSENEIISLFGCGTIKVLSIQIDAGTSQQQVSKDILNKTDTTSSQLKQHSENCLLTENTSLECVKNNILENNNYFGANKNDEPINNTASLNGQQSDSAENVANTQNLNENMKSNSYRDDVGDNVSTEIDTENMVIVKSEQTISELEEFGDDFTVTISGMMDPFLVIEISSDSDSEDENDGNR